jgi:phospholipid/cholesterol/gamma-HCH transport system substrate-binding protein
MERNANYALVGLAKTVLLLGLVFFVVWLARAAVRRGVRRSTTSSFRVPCGPEHRGEVHFNGIRVGEVTDISPTRATRTG